MIGKQFRKTDACSEPHTRTYKLFLDQNSRSGPFLLLLLPLPSPQEVPTKQKNSSEHENSYLYKQPTYLKDPNLLYKVQEGQKVLPMHFSNAAPEYI